MAARAVRRRWSRAPGVIADAADITIINYDIVHAHRARLALRRARALVFDESHYVKNPRARRTQAVRRLAEELPRGALRLALTGTPVMNHPDELIAQLRILGRLSEFGSGARFSRRFQGVGRGGAHPLAPAPHVLRAARQARRAAAAAGQAPGRRAGRAGQRGRVPARRGGRDRLAARAAARPARARPQGRRRAARRAARAAQRAAAAGRGGKPAAALAWIEDFLASDEPLVVFSGHRDVQDALLERFPDALHLVGSDSLARREEAVQAFQARERPAAARLRRRASAARASR